MTKKSSCDGPSKRARKITNQLVMILRPGGPREVAVTVKRTLNVVRCAGDQANRTVGKNKRLSDSARALPLRAPFRKVTLHLSLSRRMSRRNLPPMASDGRELLHAASVIRKPKNLKNPRRSSQRFQLVGKADRSDRRVMVSDTASCQYPDHEANFPKTPSPTLRQDPRSSLMRANPNRSNPVRRRRLPLPPKLHLRVRPLANPAARLRGVAVASDGINILAIVTPTAPTQQHGRRGVDNRMTLEGIRRGWVSTGHTSTAVNRASPAGPAT